MKFFAVLASLSFFRLSTADACVARGQPCLTGGNGACCKGILCVNTVQIVNIGFGVMCFVLTDPSRCREIVVSIKELRMLQGGSL